MRAVLSKGRCGKREKSDRGPELHGDILRLIGNRWTVDGGRWTVVCAGARFVVSQVPPPRRTRDLGHPGLCWIETGGWGLRYPTQAKLGSTPRTRTCPRGLGTGHTFFWRIERGRLRFVVSHPSEAWMGHTFLVLGERREKRPQILRSPQRPQDDIAKLEFVVSHPSGKDKDAARVGHPCLCWIETGGWGLWYPTLAARTKTPRGWGTHVCAD